MRCLVLILLGVKLQVEETGEIAPCTSATATSAATLLSEGHLNLSEGRLGTEQRLQRLLLKWNGIFPLHAFQLVG